MQLAKSERQRLIESLVSRKRVGTQFELLDALADAGCVVTQATVSRDIRELGLEKTHDPFGRPRYVLPNVTRRADPTEVLNSILGQFGRKVTPAGNVVVLQSALGSAPAIARATSWSTNGSSARLPGTTRSSSLRPRSGTRKPSPGNSPAYSPSAD